MLGSVLILDMNVYSVPLIRGIIEWICGEIKVKAPLFWSPLFSIKEQ